jgi:hypothetical protein
MKRCDQCGEFSTTVQRCKGCNPVSAVWYCGRKCQIAGWNRGHSKKCVRHDRRPDYDSMVNDLSNRNHGASRINDALKNILSFVECKDREQVVSHLLDAGDSGGLIAVLIDLFECMSESVLINVVKLFQHISDVHLELCRSKFLENIDRVEPRLISIMKVNTNSGTPYVTHLRRAVHNILYETDIVSKDIPLLIKGVSDSAIEDTLIRISIVLKRREDLYDALKEDGRQCDNDEFFLSRLIMAGLIDELEKVKGKDVIVDKFAATLLASINHEAHMIDPRDSEQICLSLERSGLRSPPSRVATRRRSKLR